MHNRSISLVSSSKPMRRQFEINKRRNKARPLPGYVKGYVEKKKKTHHARAHTLSNASVSLGCFHCSLFPLCPPLLLSLPHPLYAPDRCNYLDNCARHPLPPLDDDDNTTRARGWRWMAVVGRFKTGKFKLRQATKAYVTLVTLLIRPTSRFSLS